MRPKGIWNIVAALAVVALAWSCQGNPNQPTPLPSGLTIINENNNNNGQGGSASPSPTCLPVDNVIAIVPPTIQHGTPAPISMTASFQNQNVPLGQACAAARWNPQFPLSVANNSAANTTVNASQQDLSGASLQGCIGNACDTVIVTVN